MDAIEEREVLMENPVIVTPYINWNEVDRANRSNSPSPQRQRFKKKDSSVGGSRIYK